MSPTKSSIEKRIFDWKEQQHQVINNYSHIHTLAMTVCKKMSKNKNEGEVGDIEDYYFCIRLVITIEGYTDI
jgi:hypothetical protein